MIARYSDTPPELELSGREDALDELARALEGEGAVIECETEGVKVSPYAKLLRRVSVVVSPGRDVDIQVTEDESLRISGGRPKLAIFGKVVNDFAKEWPEGEHLHVEYYDDHPYLSSTSLPLVMTHL